MLLLLPKPLLFIPCFIFPSFPFLVFFSRGYFCDYSWLFPCHGWICSRWFQSQGAEQSLGMCLGCSGHSCTSRDLPLERCSGGVWLLSLEEEPPKNFWKLQNFLSGSVQSPRALAAFPALPFSRTFPPWSSLVPFDLCFPAFLSQARGSVSWALGAAPGLCRAPGIAERGMKTFPVPLGIAGKFPCFVPGLDLPFGAA